MKECVRRFDENISIKANKAALAIMKTEFEKAYIGVHHYEEMKDTMSKRDNEHADRIENLKDFLDGFKQNTNEEVKLLCRNVVTIQLEKYDLVARGFQKFFSEDQLSDVIDRKVDMDTLVAVKDTLSTKKEMNYVASLINAVNIRLKHMSILQQEIAKSYVPNKASSSFRAQE